jgi:hypothetical protein
MGMAQKQTKKPTDSKKLEDSTDQSKNSAKSESEDEKTEKRAEKLTERLTGSLSSTKSSDALPGSSSSDRKSETKSEKSSGRRMAAPARDSIAANDDLPSIGGLIYALQQRPSRASFYVAFASSIIWAFLCLGAGLFLFNDRLSSLSSSADMLRDPAALTLGATLFVPMALFWFLALLIWRAQELRLMASAMTEVAVRLAEPDKMAAQSVASLGQTIRRQVAAMNDAISRALGRAGELEALVHNEVAALERSYSENELRIRGLIGALASERDALANNSERVSETLRGVGAQVTKDIADVGDQATKSLTSATSTIANTLSARGAQVTKDIADVGDQATKSLASATSTIANTLSARGGKITEAVNAAGTAVDNKLSQRGSQIAQRLTAQGDEVTKKLDAAGTNVSASLQEATNKVTKVVDVKSNQLVSSLTTIGNQLVKDIPGLLDRLDGEQKRLSGIITGANHNFTALENALAQRTTQLDGTLKGHTEELKKTLSERITSLDQTVQKQAKSIEITLSDKAKAIESTLSHQAKTIEDTMDLQAKNIEGSLSKSTITLSHQAKTIEDTMELQAKNIEGSLSKSTMTMSQVFAEGTDTVKKTTEHMARQSSQANANLSSQAETLKGVSHKLLDQVFGLTQRFETQGQAIMSASQALDSSNAQIDSILERRHSEITSLLETVSTKAQALDKMMRSYSGIIEGSLLQVEERAKQVTASMAQETATQSNLTIAEIERLRAGARQHTEQAVAELTGGFQSISGEVSDQLGALTSRFGETTREMRQTAHVTADEIEGTRQELQRRIHDLPEATRHSQDAVRKAVSDQLKALGTLSALSTGNNAGVAPPPSSPPAPVQAPAPVAPNHPTQSLPPAGYNAPPAIGTSQPTGDMASVTANLVNRLGSAGGAQPQAPQPQTPPQAQQPTTGLGVTMMRNAPATPQDDGWSVGDLLARASGPDHGRQSAPPAAPAPADNASAGSGDLRLNDIASAIDQSTASNIWQRFRDGERGIFSRQLYNSQGQATFDEITGRYQRDPAFQSTVERYIGDFEKLLSDAERKGQNAQVIQNHLSSETGRVYLMLAHASGRLR